MPRRVVIVALQPVRWHPPGIPLATWRAALAEDVVDLLATLNEVDAAVAVRAGERSLAEAIAWPGMPCYELVRVTVPAVLAAATADGYDEAAVLAPDAPDLPALMVGKLLRPLTTRPVAVAPELVAEGTAAGSQGLLGVAARLPAPSWLPEIDFDSGSVAVLREAAPERNQVADACTWRRLRAAGALASLEPAVPGWEATRALISPSSLPYLP